MSLAGAAKLAATEWQQVQLRQVFRYRSGIAKIFGPSAVGVTKDYLGDLRGITTQQDWANQKAALRAEWSIVLLAKDHDGSRHQRS